MAKRERKQAGGIALRPDLWRRIERVADEQEKSRNQVMEEVLSLHVPAVPDSQKMGETRHNGATPESTLLIEED